MARYHVRVIGGWCGNRIIMVADTLKDLFDEQEFNCRVTHQSIWETYSLPPAVDLIVQLMPAFTEEEAGCAVINIRPMIRDLDHEPTLKAVLDFLSTQPDANPHLTLNKPDRELV